MRNKKIVQTFLSFSIAAALLLPEPAFASSSSARVSTAPHPTCDSPTQDANASVAAKLGSTVQIHWQCIEPGLHFAEIDTPTMKNGICVLKINPHNFSFILCSSTDEDGVPKTLSEWGDQKNLVAAINASMYLPDGITSTGYMKNGKRFNNPRIVSRFGAFFVSEPVDASLPRTGIIEKDNQNWQEQIGKYDIVIQNYRMTNRQRKILWNPGGAEYAISAVAEDSVGNILFLHSREPVEAYTFAEMILSLPLQVKTMMYVEGGSQAGLLLRTPEIRRVISGRHAASLLVTGNSSARLPNVIGVIRKLSE